MRRQFMKAIAIMAAIAAGTSQGATIARTAAQTTKTATQGKEAINETVSTPKPTEQRRNRLGGFSNNRNRHQWVPGNQRQYRKKMRSNPEYARGRKNQRTRYK